MSSTPSTPLSPGELPPSSATSTPTFTGKQLHPSESQIASEHTDGAPPSSIGSQNLSAPKPTVIETRVGPMAVSPKVSSRSLGGSLAGGVNGSRSPAYSASSSPRGVSSRALSSATVNPNTDEIERRGSGTFGNSLLASLNTINSSIGGAVPISGLSSGSLSASSSTGSLLTSPGPAMVRRSSKPFVLHAPCQNSSLQAILAKYTVEDIELSRRNVIELPSTASPAEGFDLLLKHNVLSCPVYDVEKENVTGKRSYIGFLDIRDLVSSIVFAHEEQNLVPTGGAGVTGVAGIIFGHEWNTKALETTMQRFFGSAVSVSYLSRRNPFKPIRANATLLQVARLLSTQIHRLPVVDEEGRCISIISQSSLIQFLHNHREEIKNDLSQTLSQLQLGLCKVISVNSDASAWQAFKVLETNNVSGIAIVDRDGKLVANTSARDLKHFVQNKGALSLDAPIVDYLAKIRQRDYIDEVHPSSSVGVNTTIAHCIGLLAATGYHRVFVVDANGRPIGVLSVTDVLRFAAAETVHIQPPSNPTTPRGNLTNSRRTSGVDHSPSSSSSSSSSATPSFVTSPSPPSSSATPSSANTPFAHRRTVSQSNTPIVTPAPGAH